MKIATPVDLIILNKKQQILLLRRSENEDFDIGKWSIPGGGIEKNETNEIALKREILEETNCKIKWFKPFKEFEYVMSDKIVRAMYYYGEINGEIKLSKEHSAFSWFDFSQISSLEIAFNQKKVLLEFIKFYNKFNLQK